MKTVLQILVEKIDDYKKESGVLSINIDILKQEIQDFYFDLEKKQIEKAYNSGLAHEFGCMEENKYYKETFNQPLKGI